MTDPTVMGNLQWFATLGVGGVLAAVIFMFYRKDMKQSQDMWKGQSEMFALIVKENTTAITNNTATIQALHRREDVFEEAFKKLGFSFGPHRAKDRDD